MPLDHFVPQVYLKKWYSPTLGQLMYATRKSNLNTFTPNSDSVCRIKDGSTNKFLKDERVVEKFLKTVEPKYTKVIENIISKKIDNECIYTISGVISYILTCSPTAVRLNVSPLKKILEETAIALDKMGKLPKPPSVLRAESLTKLFFNKEIQINVDTKYPQAIGITTIFSTIKMLGNFTWEILCNPYKTNPFFTSDYPIVSEPTKNPQISKKIFPLTPYIAVAIHPDLKLKEEIAKRSFPYFKYNFRKTNYKEIAKINKLIVQSAEDMVFYREKYNWIENFIRKNSKYRIESVTSKIGHYICASQKVVETLTCYVILLQLYSAFFNCIYRIIN